MMKITVGRRVLGGVLTAVSIAGGLALGVLPEAQAETQPSEIEVGPSWTDVDGNLVAAHGGAANAYRENVIGIDVTGDGDKDDLVYLLYGENKANATRPVDGVNGYWSTDLENWYSMGTVLPTHNVLPHKVVTIGQGGAAGSYTDFDSITYESDRMISQTGTVTTYGSTGHPSTTQKYTVVSDENLAELKRLGNMTAAEAQAQGVTEEAASAAAFVEAYVTVRDGAGRATAYDEESLKLAFENLYGMYNIAERPKMIYNAANKQFVIIYHSDGAVNANADRITWVEGLTNSSYGVTGGRDYFESGATNTGSRYSRAQVGYAVSDSPFGPFKLVNSTRMNFDKSLHGTRFGEARDMTVFVDNGKDSNNDGVDDAYVAYSSEINKWMYMSLLNADYTAPIAAGDSQPESSSTWRSRVLPDTDREASSIFYWDGWYYMLTSGTDGWNSTPVVYYRAKSMLQDEPWERIGNPFVGTNATRGYDSQPTYVLVKDQAKGEFIYMGDRWAVEPRTGSAGPNSKLIWLPIKRTGNPQAPLQIEGRASWDPHDPTLYSAITPVHPLSFSATEGDDAGLIAQLPSTVDIIGGGVAEPASASVSWETDPAALHNVLLFPGSTTLQGTLTLTGEYAKYSGAKVTASLTVTPAANRVAVELGGWVTSTPAPSSVTIDGAQVAVKWEASSIELAQKATAFSSVRLAGVAVIEGVSTRVVASATAVPWKPAYVIDSGREGLDSGVVGAASAAGAPLLNAGVADQRWDGVAAGKTWGYSTASTVGVTAGNAANWGSSYIGANYNQPVVYHLALPAGTYQVGAVQAPRGTTSTNVYAKVSAGGTELSRQTATSGGEATPVVQTVTVPQEGVVDVEFGTNGTSGFNARLALIWVAKAAPAVEFDAAAASKCVAGRAFVEASAKNTSTVPMDFAVKSSIGERLFTAIDPGKTKSVTLPTRETTTAAGAVSTTATVDGYSVTRNVWYSSISCK